MSEWAEALRSALIRSSAETPGAWIMASGNEPSPGLAEEIESGVFPELRGLDLQVFTRGSAPTAECDHAPNTWEIHVRIRP